MTIQQAIALAFTMHESVVLLSQRQKEESPQVAGLTSREAEVLRLVAEGQSNKEIAAQLVLSVRTVEGHITNLYGKINARAKLTRRPTQSTTASCSGSVYVEPARWRG